MNDLTTKGGKPMVDEDFAKVEMDLRRKIDETRMPTSYFKSDAFQTGKERKICFEIILVGQFLGNWSGDDKFYHSSKTPWKMKIEDDSAEFISIPSKKPIKVLPKTLIFRNFLVFSVVRR